MPNFHGGKAYKKVKKVAPEAAGGKFDDELEDGQMYARVTRMLGDRRVTCFCNDGVERICKIRGALCRGPKKQRIVVNDLVIISFRDFDGSGSDSSDDKAASNGVADIVAWVPPQHHRQVKKRTDNHRDLFGGTTESADGLDDLFDEEETTKDEEVDIDAI